MHNFILSKLHTPSNCAMSQCHWSLCIHLLLQVMKLVPSLHVLDGRRLDVYTQKSQERAAAPPLKRKHDDDDTHTDTAPTLKETMADTTREPAAKHKSTAPVDAGSQKPATSATSSTSAPVHKPHITPASTPASEPIKSKHRHGDAHDGLAKKASSGFVKRTEETKAVEDAPTVTDAAEVTDAVDKPPRESKKKSKKEKHSEGKEDSRRSSKAVLVVSKPDDDERVSSGVMSVISVKRAKRASPTPLPWEQTAGDAPASWD
jgi:hypothetical protein